MKLLRPRFLTSCLAAALALPVIPLEAAPEKTIRLRPDHASLAALRANGPTVKGRTLAAQPVEPGTPKERPGLLGRSTLLAFNGYWTMVPKRAVLHLPESLRSRVVTRPSGKLLTWREFSARNRGWLHLQDVTLAHARGETPLAPEVFESYRTIGRVVVAVCEGGPISMPARQEAQASL